MKNHTLQPCCCRFPASLQPIRRPLPLARSIIWRSISSLTPPNPKRTQPFPLLDSTRPCDDLCRR